MPEFEAVLNCGNTPSAILSTSHILLDIFQSKCYLSSLDSESISILSVFLSEGTLIHHCLIFHESQQLTSSEELLPLALLVGSEAGHGVVAVLPRLARLADVDLVQAPGQDHTAVTPQVPPPLPA